jgi:AraC family transcriptional regulator of adaptative response / DNA-3-methyladenine glycosylase II
VIEYYKLARINRDRNFDGRFYFAGSDIIDNALNLIYKGFLNYKSLPEFADKLFISERHLRKLFVDNLGLFPVKIAKYHKSVFARKRIKNSDLPVTEIAFASGFGSIRQFNDIYKDVFGESPLESRKKSTADRQDKTVFLLPYRKPFDYGQVLSFIKPRIIPGVENGHVPRLPAAFDVFEFIVRSVLGQQISVKAATTLAGLMQHCVYGI